MAVEFAGSVRTHLRLEEQVTGISLNPVPANFEKCLLLKGQTLIIKTTCLQKIPGLNIEISRCPVDWWTEKLRT